MPRTRVINIRPVTRAAITATPAQMCRIAENPHTLTATHLERVGPNRVRAVITQSSLRPARIRRRMPFRITVDPGAARAARQAGRITARISCVTAGLFGAGWLTWQLWGTEITHALRIFLVGAAVILSVAALAWWASSKAGVCPGYHCPGCPHSK